MPATIKNDVVTAFELIKEEEIAAPIDIVFETILEQMGPLQTVPEGPVPMVLEPWPGGRWFRDLGNGSGHFWGTVQAIKAPTLLEITGPLFMSSPVANNVQYRLSEENGVTLMRIVHRSMGWIDDVFLSGDRSVNVGWAHFVDRIHAAALQRAKSK